MIDVSSLLHCLAGVRQHGHGRWSARCPAHDDRSPSLSIRQADDRILLYCHAGCDTSSILTALGLGWKDICPERDIPYQQALAHINHQRRRTLDEIDAKDYAKWVLTLAAADLEAGLQHSLEDRATIEVAREVMRHGR